MRRGLEAQVFGAEDAERDGEGAGGRRAVRDGGREEVVVGFGPGRFCFGRGGVCCRCGGRGRAPASGGGGGGVS